MTGVSRLSLRGVLTIVILWFMWHKKNLYQYFGSLRRLILQWCFVNIRIDTVSTMSLLWGAAGWAWCPMVVVKGGGALDARLCMVVHDSSWFIWKSDLISCGGFAAKKYKKQTEAPSDPDARSQLRKGKKMILAMKGDLAMIGRENSPRWSGSCFSLEIGIRIICDDKKDENQKKLRIIHFWGFLWSSQWEKETIFTCSLWNLFLPFFLEVFFSLK